MELGNAEIKAKELINQYCPEYTFEWHNFKRLFGYCNWRKKTIALSKDLVLLNGEAEVLNTILHEIAHALAPKEGHNKVWQRQAISIGCTGRRCYSKDVIKPPAKYRGICPNCSIFIERLKRKNVACKWCCDKYSNHKYDIKYKLVWEKIK